MSDDPLAEKFRALGDPTRMRIFRLLTASSEEDRLCAGEVCRRLTGANRINSTISAHLKELRRAGLIQMEKQGRRVFFRANPTGMRDMLTFLMGVEDMGDS